MDEEQKKGDMQNQMDQFKNKLTHFIQDYKQCFKYILS